MFTKDAYVDWRTSKVTKELVAAVTEYRKSKLEEIAEGRVQNHELYIEIGRCQGMKDTLEFLLNMNGELREFFLVETDNDQRDKETV